MNKVHSFPVRREKGKAFWALATVLAFLAVVTVNALANILPINGVNTGTLSDEIPNLFVPAGLTFSIWGLIYTLLAGYSIAVLVEAFGKKPLRLWSVADGVIFFVNAVANIAWILLWHYRMVGFSLVIMLIILATLVALGEQVYERKREFKARTHGHAPARDKVRFFFLSVPILVYLGWICVATIANVTALLVTSRWDGFGIDPVLWTVVAIGAGAVVAIALAFLRSTIAAPLVVVWAYAGIVIKRTSVDPAQTEPVWIAAVVCAVAVLVAVAVSTFRHRVSRT